MHGLVAVLAILLILVVLWDGFESMVLPRRVSRPFRPARLVFRLTWLPWTALARRVTDPGKREALLSIFGPLGMLLLLGVWAAGLVLGFGVLQWAFGSAVADSHGTPSLGSDLYMSATTFFTLGLGDVVPVTPLARAVTAIEAGVGFGFLALTISYLPVLYQAFSRREVNISLLDARAGSPPSAVEILRRHSSDRHQADSHQAALEQFLRDWERWSADLLESHLSYPAVAYFRSQHDNQSWLSALTSVLDVCALIVAMVDSTLVWQAQLTFAMARHAAVDLAQVFNTPPQAPTTERLVATDLARMRKLLLVAGVPLREGDEAGRELAALRRMYEPYVVGLSRFLLMPLPSWIPPEEEIDAWQTSAWDHGGDAAGGRGRRRAPIPRARVRK